MLLKHLSNPGHFFDEISFSLATFLFFRFIFANKKKNISILIELMLSLVFVWNSNSLTVVCVARYLGGKNIKRRQFVGHNMLSSTHFQRLNFCQHDQRLKQAKSLWKKKLNLHQTIKDWNSSDTANRNQVTFSYIPFFNLNTKRKKENRKKNSRNIIETIRFM